MNYDTAKSTEPDQAHGSCPSRRALFPYSCSGLVRMVQDAADRRFVDGWHDRHRVDDAVLRAKHVLREARALGLYPTTAQLAADVQLRIQIDMREWEANEWDAPADERFAR